MNTDKKILKDTKGSSINCGQNMNLFCAVQSAGALLIQHLPCGSVRHSSPVAMRHWLHERNTFLFDTYYVISRNLAKTPVHWSFDHSTEIPWSQFRHTGQGILLVHNENGMSNNNGPTFQKPGSFQEPWFHSILESWICAWFFVKTWNCI